MKRYIDAEKVIDILDQSINIFDATDRIKVLKAADVVEVVRCKDCKYYLNSNEKCGLIDTRLRFYETDKRWTGDCFCAWGERREDDQKRS